MSHNSSKTRYRPITLAGPRPTPASSTAPGSDLASPSRITLSAAVLIGALAGRAALGNEVSFQCVPLPPAVVADGDALDLDSAVNRVKVEFDCTVDDGAGNVWRAIGTLIGVAEDPFSATTSIDSITIANVSGNINDALFLFDHSFLPLGPPMLENTASIEGYFDNLIEPGLLWGAMLDYHAVVHYPGDAETIDSAIFGWAAGVAPIPFFDDGGCVAVAHPDRHSGQLLFYLDSPGDAIIMEAGHGGVHIVATTGFLGAASPCAGCPADVNDDEVVDVLDLLLVLAEWGPCVPACEGDVNDDGVVDVLDLLEVLAAWGPCSS